MSPDPPLIATCGIIIDHRNGAGSYWPGELIPGCGSCPGASSAHAMTCRLCLPPEGKPRALEHRELRWLTRSGPT